MQQEIKTAPKKKPLPEKKINSVRFPIRFREFENGHFRKLKIFLIRPFDYMLYFIIFLISYSIVKIIHGAKISGREKLPKKRGAIIISNHSLLLEPPYLAFYSFPGQNYFTSNIYNLTTPFLKNFLRHVNTMPLFQGKRYPESHKFILLALKKSHVHFYPEGYISHMSNRMLKFKLGAFRIAIETGLPIYPLVFFKRRIRLGSLSLPFIIRAHAEIYDPVLINDFKPENGDIEIWAENLASHCYNIMQSRLNDYMTMHNLSSYPNGS